MYTVMNNPVIFKSSSPTYIAVRYDVLCHHLPGRTPLGRGEFSRGHKSLLLAEIGPGWAVNNPTVTCGVASGQGAL